MMSLVIYGWVEPTTMQMVDAGIYSLEFLATGVWEKSRLKGIMVGMINAEPAQIASAVADGSLLGTFDWLKDLPTMKRQLAGAPTSDVCYACRMNLRLDDSEFEAVQEALYQYVENCQDCDDPAKDAPLLAPASRILDGMNSTVTRLAEQARPAPPGGVEPDIDLRSIG
jgi:hypothetical protein